jgi:hypothetical protein
MPGARLFNVSPFGAQMGDLKQAPGKFLGQGPIPAHGLFPIGWGDPWNGPYPVRSVTKQFGADTDMEPYDNDIHRNKKY